MAAKWKCTVVALASLVALSLAAQGTLQVKVKELASHPFRNKDLVVTIAELDGYKAFSPQRKHSGRARVALSLENASSEFKVFSPQDLSLVGKDGFQVFPIYELNLADDTIPMALHLVPGARVKVEYVLTGRLSFPAKIYLGGVLVAEVSE